MTIPTIDNTNEMMPSFLACGGSETAAELAATVQISVTTLPRHIDAQSAIDRNWAGGKYSTYWNRIVFLSQIL